MHKERASIASVRYFHMCIADFPMMGFSTRMNFGSNCPQLNDGSPGVPSSNLLSSCFMQEWRQDKKAHIEETINNTHENIYTRMNYNRHFYLFIH